MHMNTVFVHATKIKTESTGKRGKCILEINKRKTNYYVHELSKNLNLKLKLN